MLCECDEAEAVFGGPELDLAIITTCCKEIAIWRVGDSIQVEEVTLLLEDVSLTLPLPNKELALLFACHCNPVTSRVDGYAINLVLRDLEGVDGVESVEIIKAEHAIRLSDYENDFAQFRT